MASSSCPPSWIEAATKLQTSNGSNPNSDWDQGYGYQFWRCRHDVYRGDGAFGQYCIVLPDHDAVVAINSGVRNMQAVLNLVWDKLLPSMKDGPLPADTTANNKLKTRLKNLSLPVVEGTASAANVSGKKYTFAQNGQTLEVITIVDNDPMTITIRAEGREQHIVFGRGDWRKQRMAWGILPEQPMAATGAWTADGTFTGKLCFYETPYVYTIRLTFAGQELQYNAEANVAFGPTQQPQLTGRAE